MKEEKKTAEEVPVQKEIREGKESPVQKETNRKNQALEMVIKQAGIIDTMSKEVVTSTNEQKNSMAHTQGTIDRLSEMAQEISQSNSLIIDFAKIIHDKALELDRVIRSRKDEAVAAPALS